MVGYTQKVDPEKTSKAIGKEIKISPKKAEEVVKMIRGMKVEAAKVYLKKVKAELQPVKYTRYKKYLSHKKGVGPGRYPVNAATEILKVIESAQHNAEYKGLDSENMQIHTIAIHRGRIQKRSMPRAYGRATPWNALSSHIEVILEELETS